MTAPASDATPRSSGIRLLPDMEICQSDLPLDWYQEEFKPYAQEYLALRDRTPESVLPWMDRYLEPARGLVIHTFWWGCASVAMDSAMKCTADSTMCSASPCACACSASS